MSKNGGGAEAAVTPDRVSKSVRGGG